MELLGEGSTDPNLLKKPKYENRDRLSELPEALIAQIISLLPIEEAVRTGVLSKSWEKHWKYTDKLVFYFDHRMETEARKKNFISIVDHTLMQCVCPKTFSIFVLKSFKDESNLCFNLLDKWLEWLYSRNVENLGVKICNLSYAPRVWFYHNSNLVKLEIRCWDFTTLESAVVSWTSLKSLTLHYVSIGDEQIAKMLSGCPLLEDLDLRNATLKSLNITSPRLIKLSMNNNWDDDDIVSLLEINAPFLQFLTLFCKGVVRFIDVSSLVHANINFTNDDELEKVLHVQELTVGHMFITSLSMLKLSGRPSCPLFFKGKRLIFDLPVCKHELPGITFLLQKSPHLETLVLKIRKYDLDETHQEIKGICNFDAAWYLSTETGDFPHLKSIEVTYCKGCPSEGYYCNCEVADDDKDDEEFEFFVFELVACIMRKSPVLKKLVIAPQKEFCRNSKYCALEDASMLCHKLLQSSSQLFTDRKVVCEWKLRKETNDSYFEFIF